MNAWEDDEQRLRALGFLQIPVLTSLEERWWTHPTRRPGETFATEEALEVADELEQEAEQRA